MRNKLKKLLRIQIQILAITLIIAVIAGKKSWLGGLSAGGLTAIMTTIMAMLIFYRLPPVVPAKIFYTALMINEALKWALVISVGVLLIPHVAPLALAVGFAVTYLAYFGLILETNRD